MYEMKNNNNNNKKLLLAARHTRTAAAATFDMDSFKNVHFITFILIL